MTLAIRALVEELDIDLVNSHWILPQGLSTPLARGPSVGFRHVITFGRAIARSIFRQTDAVIAVSSAMRNDLDEALGMESRALVQPNGVHVDKFRVTEDKDPVASPFPGGYLLYFGRLTEFKGVSYLLRALPRIRLDHPGIGLMVVGYGNLEERLKNETASLGIRESVRFEGRKMHDEIACYLAGCRAVVIPSIVDRRGRTEGIPTVALEALASGARVVASEVAGIPEVIQDGENGWLCRERDPEDLAAKLRLALSDPPGSGVREAALRTAERHDWSRVAERYTELFRTLVQDERQCISPSTT